MKQSVAQGKKKKRKKERRKPGNGLMIAMIDVP